MSERKGYTESVCAGFSVVLVRFLGALFVQMQGEVKYIWWNSVNRTLCVANITNGIRNANGVCNSDER